MYLATSSAKFFFAKLCCQPQMSSQATALLDVTKGLIPVSVSGSECSTRATLGRAGTRACSVIWPRSFFSFLRKRKQKASTYEVIQSSVLRAICSSIDSLFRSLARVQWATSGFTYLSNLERCKKRSKMMMDRIQASRMSPVAGSCIWTARGFRTSAHNPQGRRAPANNEHQSAKS